MVPGTVKNFKVGDNEIAYMETYLVDDSHGSVALSPKTIKGHHDNKYDHRYCSLVGQFYKL
jgi:hypothetical protein